MQKDKYLLLLLAAADGARQLRRASLTRTETALHVSYKYPNQCHPSLEVAHPTAPQKVNVNTLVYAVGPVLWPGACRDGAMEGARYPRPSRSIAVGNPSDGCATTSGRCLGAFQCEKRRDKSSWMQPHYLCGI